LKVPEKRVIRRIFGPKREEVVGGWERMHNEELHNFNAPPNIINMTQSRSMRWAGHVTCMGDEGCVQNFDCKS
jgi:hypothetical protein